MANKKERRPEPDFFDGEPEQDPDNTIDIEVGETRTGPITFFDNTDVTEIENKDPNYKYRWTLQKKVAKQRRERGYEVVDKNSKESATCGDEDAKSGKTIGGGELVMMKVPKESAEAYQKHVTKQSSERRADALRRKGKGGSI